MSARGLMAAHMGMGWGMMEDGGGGWRKGPWTAEEDRLLIEYVKVHGEGRWNSVARLTGLRRNGKSCRLRWVNYLRPDLKRGQITPHEESIILELHARWGNRWSTIARSLPGRTDNEIKNYWRTHFKKKTKTCANEADKSKTRLLKKQKFQQQQYQFHQQLQQQQTPLPLPPPSPPSQFQQQFTTLDMKKIISLLLDDGETKLTENEEVGSNYLYPTSASSTTEEQGGFYSMFNSDISTSEESNEDVLWDGIWNNMDDIQGNTCWSTVCSTNKVDMHNFAAPFC